MNGKEGGKRVSGKLTVGNEGSSRNRNKGKKKEQSSSSGEETEEEVGAEVQEEELVNETENEDKSDAEEEEEEGSEEISGAEEEGTVLDPTMTNTDVPIVQLSEEEFKAMNNEKTALFYESFENYSQLRSNHYKKLAGMYRRHRSMTNRPNKRKSTFSSDSKKQPRQKKVKGMTALEKKEREASFIQGPWTEAEVGRFNAAVNAHGVDLEKISRQVFTRSRKQVQERLSELVRNQISAGGLVGGGGGGGGPVAEPSDV